MAVTETTFKGCPIDKSPAAAAKMGERARSEAFSLVELLQPRTPDEQTAFDEGQAARLDLGDPAPQFSEATSQAIRRCAALIMEDRCPTWAYDAAKQVVLKKP